jgi:hypothetical protein
MLFTAGVSFGTAALNLTMGDFLDGIANIFFFLINCYLFDYYRKLSEFIS